MSDPLIDPIEFSRQQREVFGQWPLSELDRVKTAVVEDDAVVSYHVGGALDTLGRPVLSVRVGGEVRLVCQRCMEPLPVPLAISTDITLFGSEDELVAAESDDPDLECLLVEEAGDVKALVEDEILLALPYVAVHDECIGLGGDDDDEELPAASPFAALAALKRSN